MANSIIEIPEVRMQLPEWWVSLHSCDSMYSRGDTVAQATFSPNFGGTLDFQLRNSNKQTVHVSDLGDVTQVEEVVDLGWRGQEALHNGVVQLYGRLRHDVANGLHLLLKVLKFLVDHAAKDSLDLGLLPVGKKKKMQN